MPITTCVFDAYGTLFDVAAAAHNLTRMPFAAHPAALPAVAPSALPARTARAASRAAYTASARTAS